MTTHAQRQEIYQLVRDRGGCRDAQMCLMFNTTDICWSRYEECGVYIRRHPEPSRPPSIEGREYEFDDIGIAKRLLRGF